MFCWRRRKERTQRLRVPSQPTRSNRQQKHLQWNRGMALFFLQRSYRWYFRILWILPYWVKGTKFHSHSWESFQLVGWFLVKLKLWCLEQKDQETKRRQPMWRRWRQARASAGTRLVLYPRSSPNTHLQREEDPGSPSELRTGSSRMAAASAWALTMFQERAHWCRI